MELVDLYDDQKELTGKIADKRNIPQETYRLCVHVWITNDKGELLLQQRVPTANKFPNMWSVTGGAVQAGETSLEGALREMFEELGISAEKDEMKFLASYKRKIDYMDVWLLKKNVDINDIVMQEDEVQDVKWVTEKEFEEMLENNTAIRSSYDYYKLYTEPKF